MCRRCAFFKDEEEFTSWFCFFLSFRNDDLLFYYERDDEKETVVKVFENFPLRRELYE